MSVAEFVAQQVGDRAVKAVSGGQIKIKTKRVHTMRGVQNHRGYQGYVYVKFEGERRPETFYCCAFHQKPKAAREHAATLSRAFQRQITQESTV